MLFGLQSKYRTVRTCAEGTVRTVVEQYPWVFGNRLCSGFDVFGWHDPIPEVVKGAYFCTPFFIYLFTIRSRIKQKIDNRTMSSIKSKPASFLGNVSSKDKMGNLVNTLLEAVHLTPPPVCPYCIIANNGRTPASTRPNLSP